MEAYRQYSDAAKRISDEVTMHALAGNAMEWASFKLSDGTSGHRTYPTRIDAVKDQRWHMDDYFYVQIPPDGMPAREAQELLEYRRAMRDAGWELPSADFDFDDSMPMFEWDKRKTIAHLTSGGKLYS
jgi:hypothetical protein